MVEKNITDYYDGLREVMEYYTRCWKNSEGRFEVVISDNKGTVEWCIKGGHTRRSSRKDNEVDE